jgi:hypothetical protein
MDEEVHRRRLGTDCSNTKSLTEVLGGGGRERLGWMDEWK